MEELDLNRVNLKIQFHEEGFSEKFISECINSYRELMMFNSCQVFNKKRERALIVLDRYLERNKNMS